MKQLWREYFKPSLIPVSSADPELAWGWVFEKDESGDYIRAVMALKVIREQALMIKKSGRAGDYGTMAMISIYNRCKVDSVDKASSAKTTRFTAGPPPRKLR